MFDNKEKIIEIKDLCFSYTQDPVLQNLNYTLLEGETSAIVGGNGSGKSTLIKVMLGELKASSGEVKLFGRPLDEIHDFSDLGYVPQVNVIDTVSFPVTSEEMLALSSYKTMGTIKVPRKKDYQRARQALADSNLLAYAKVPFNELSGGLQQRVMIALSMMNHPRLLILDEPTAGVDQESKLELFSLLEKLKRENNLTVLIITHEIDFINEVLSVENTYEMKEGALVRV